MLRLTLFVLGGACIGWALALLLHGNRDLYILLCVPLALGGAAYVWGERNL